MSKGYFIETDIIVDYLCSPKDVESILRKLLVKQTCYTSFIQVSELYSKIKNKIEKQKVDEVIYGLKVLGASSRYSTTIGTILSSLGNIHNKERIAISAAISIESNLIMVTIDKSKFQIYNNVEKVELLNLIDLKVGC
ncbi:MAG: hypothetical protein IPP08_06330 [Chlorobiota bacterium]|jgi:predicted nucleic acid-binding protein|nr:hypothetical protein [Chlorobiota bacterium]QQS67775.1 MAG: hypothetical protein IPP08_06330 [Chlorobiota bacterium]